LLDQRKLPGQLEYFDATSFDDLCFAIKEMIVRGAPSIGVAAAFGFAIEAARLSHMLKAENLLKLLPSIKEKLDNTRPTAVNLHWATDRLLAAAVALLSEPITSDDFRSRTLSLAQEIFDEHIQTNCKISSTGATLVKQNASIITHCNAGPLAVCGWGTALGIIRFAHFAVLNPHVYVDETRPRNQGAKLTMWELAQDKVAATLICDNMSGYLMSSRKVDMVITGADRIATNGDSANKIGTYNLAVVAKYHSVPFYIAAPLSTFDAVAKTGGDIPIEERDSIEVTHIEGKSITAQGVCALNPAFDVTPAQLIDGIVTEVGILRPPYLASIAAAFGQSTFVRQQNENIQYMK
jgi:methylthioribose-1-phosphate isomerase